LRDSITDMDVAYNAGQVARILQKDSMAIAKMGQLITPHREANGRGYRAAYSFRNMVEMKILEELSYYGVPQKKIQKYIHNFGKATNIDWLVDPQTNIWLVITGWGKWAIGNNLDDAMGIVSLGQHEMAISAIVVNIGKIKQDVRAGLGRIMED